MRDHKGDPAPRKSIERLKDMLFRCRIQVRGRFIKDEDSCVFQKCASDRKRLPFPARETDPALADECAVSISQLHDELMQARRLAGADALVLPRPRPTVRARLP